MHRIGRISMYCKIYCIAGSVSRCISNRPKSGPLTPSMLGFYFGPNPVRPMWPHSGPSLGVGNNLKERYFSCDAGTLVFGLLFT